MAKNNIVGLKELRENIETYIRRVRKGDSFTVVRRSKPVFRISSPDEDAEEFWESVVDFTKIRKGGVPAEEVLASLRRLKK
jgi:prevent-host-death family protein